VLFRSDLDSAGSSVFPVGPGRCGLFLLRSEGKEGMAGVPSRWEGTGQEGGESGKAGVPSQWEGTGQESGESGKAGVPSQWGGTGQEKAGTPGFPRNGRDGPGKRRKRVVGWVGSGVGVGAGARLGAGRGPGSE
jgi:hypothetical protein